MKNYRSDFAFFRANKQVVYLDTAATSQVHDDVRQVVSDSLSYKASIGRGDSKISREIEKNYNSAVLNIANYINSDSDELVFCSNSTDAVNLFFNSLRHLFEPGDEVIITEAEHNSIFFPIKQLQDLGVKIRVLELYEYGVDIDDLQKYLSPKTKLVAINHVSNVLGVINNVDLIGKTIKEYNSDILYLIDAAQSIAKCQIDVKQLQCDALFFAGHKMYGPDGIAVLYLDKKIHSDLKPIRIGGGSVRDFSIVDNSGEFYYDLSNSVSGLTGGTPNLSGVLGLSAAFDFIMSVGLLEIKNHEQRLLRLLYDGLQAIEDLEILGPQNISNRSGLISFTSDVVDLNELVEYLNKRNFCVRFGYHCAFFLGDKIKKESLRVSFGIYNDEDDVNLFLDNLKRYLQKKSGQIVNPNYEFYKDLDFNSQDFVINKIDDVLKYLFKLSSENSELEVVLMAGHFLSIPDFDSNSFYPSVKGLLPERLDGLLDEFGMNSFPLDTWEIGCKVLKQLKKHNVASKLLVLANDTTGINELKNSSANQSAKTANEYMIECLNRFGEGVLPDVYLNLLAKYNLELDDVLSFEDGNYYIRETILRSRFKDFIKANKGCFDGLIDYGLDKNSNLSLEIPILRTPDVRECVFDTFNSKTGGKFCIVEVCQLLAEIFGKDSDIDFKRLSKSVRSPISKSKHRVFVMLTPAMCNNAVNSAGELYYKLFHQSQADFDFTFINIPLGKKPVEFMKNGTQMTILKS